MDEGTGGFSSPTWVGGNLDGGGDAGVIGLGVFSLDKADGVTDLVTSFTGWGNGGGAGLGAGGGTGGTVMDGGISVLGGSKVEPSLSGSSF